MNKFQELLDAARQSYQSLLTFRHDPNFSLMTTEAEYERDKTDCLAYLDSLTKVVNGTLTQEEFYHLYPDAP